MIERIENTIQIAVLLVCFVVSILLAVKRKSRTWTLLAFFYGSWWLGDLYWLFCLLYYDRTPQISVVSDLSWFASYLFLYMILRYTALAEKKKLLLPWLGPVFAAGMAVFFMQWGEIASNLVYAVLMSFLLFEAIRDLSDEKRRFLSAVVLVFCLLEYGLWISSCYWKTDTLSNPYYWFDLLLTVSFTFFLPATRRAAEL